MNLQSMLIPKRVILIGLLFIIFGFPAFAQKNNKEQVKQAPAWVDFNNRTAKFPRNAYVSGFASEKYSGYEDINEVYKRLEGQARHILVESIHVTIKSLTSTQVIVQNTQTADFFKHSSVSFSKVTITGLTVENFYDEKEKAVYAFAFAQTAKISEHYINLISNKKAEAERNLADAKEYIAKSNNKDALKACYANFPIFTEIEEAQALIVTFQGLTLENPVLHAKAVADVKLQTNETIQSLQKGGSLTLDDAAFFMANGLAFQIDTFSAPIRISNFTFEDSKMGSVFAKRFTKTLEQQLAQKSVNMTEDATLNGVAVEYMLSGTYWEEGENLKLIAVVRNLKTGKPIAGSEAIIPKKWLAANSITYKPENFEQAYSNLIKFNSDAVISEGGLIVDLSTNNGDENLIFTQGDTLKLYIKANRECYVRFIYTLADGTRVQMLDNLYVDRDKVNKIYEMPDKFIIDTPYGVEALTLNAQTKPFDKLRTVDYYGYNKIVDDLNTVLANTRGFKPVQNIDGKAEKSITLTTLSKDSKW